ncbi:MAG TPA: flagellar brake protein [Syntrophobacteraceae bacterium]|nr:flagellar brake protein [Syntrophobacteraceae bacterium]
MPDKVHGVVRVQTLNIGIGTRLQLQIGQEGQKYKIGGILTGMAPDEFLMISIPAYPGILNRLTAGTLIVGRYVYAGNVYGFNSTILNFIQKPVLLVFLTYPATVEKVNLRQSQRVECRFPAKVWKGNGVLRAVIVDISLGGCRVCIDSGESGFSSFNVGQTVELSFHLAGIQEEQVTEGSVKNLRMDGQYCEMGVGFDPNNEGVLNNVKLYLDSFASDG